MHEWISVTDRLPKDGECVLVLASTTHSNADVNIMSVIYDGTAPADRMFVVDHFCESSYVEAEYWMPLPEMPK